MTYFLTKKITESIDTTEKKVANALKIPTKTFYNGSRDTKSAKARFILFYALHDIYGLPYSLIAERYNMHYTSVIHGVEMANKYELTKIIVW